jgi:hypothetical protein
VACPFRKSRLQVKSGGIGLVSGEPWPPRSTPAELRRVGDALIARMPEIVERHFDELRDTVPGYESLSVEDLRELWRDSFTSAAREIFVSAAVVTPEEVRGRCAQDRRRHTNRISHRWNRALVRDRVGRGERPLRGDRRCAGHAR